MTKPNILLILTGLLLAFTSCRPKVANKTDVDQVDSLATSPKWKLVKLDSSSFYQPATWGAIKHDSCYYFAYLDNADKGKCFQIKKYKLSANGLTAISYLHSMYKGLLNSNLKEKFDGYNVKKVTMGLHDVYYSEIYTSENKKLLLSCSLIFTDKDYLYNIGIKIDRTECARYKNTLDNIVYNFKINGKNIFDTAAKPGEERVVDISKI